MDAPVKRCKKIDLSRCRRGRSRPRKSWSEVIRNDLETLGLKDNMVQDRNMWKSRSRVADCR